MSAELGMKFISAASERPALQHSCGWGQWGPADPAGEVGRERTCSSLPLPAGTETRQASQERRRRARLPGRPKARSLSCCGGSAPHAAPIPGHPDGRAHPAARLASPPRLTRGPKPGSVLTRQLLASSSANKQRELSPRGPARDVPPCAKEPDGCGHPLPNCLGDSPVNSCYLLFASIPQQCRPSAFPSPLVPACLSFPCSWCSWQELSRARGGA